MDKELNCPPLFGMEISSGQFQNCFFQSNWGNSIDQNDPFESALSSMVSSPTIAGVTSNGGDLISGDGMMIRELIGRLGSICDSNNSSSTKTSCYSTPLNSPPKLDLSNLMIMGSNGNFPNYPPNLGSFNTDPGFVERAARFSSLKIDNNSIPKLECGKLSRVSSNDSMKIGKGGNVVMDVKFGGISTTENGEMVDSREGSSVSEQNPVGDLGLKAQNGANSRKRKPIPLAKVKDLPSQDAKVQKVGAENEESNAKRSKQESDNEEDKKQNAEQKTEQKTGDTSNNKGKQNSNNEETAKPEPPKDYIHVRARRGQATDSHSLAERVRREKISERMRFLQDLVPGCNKVTGKATVLDEIINYVQSLQRQVEFLSMKLATVNPRMEFNLEAHLSKDMIQTRGAGISPTMYPFDQTYSFDYQSSQRFSSPLPNGSENPFPLNPLNATGIRRNPGIPLPSMDGFVDPLTQVPTFWEDDLQSIVQNQMGITQNQTQNVPDNSPHAQMKLEL